MARRAIFVCDVSAVDGEVDVCYVSFRHTTSPLNKIKTLIMPAFGFESTSSHYPLHFLLSSGAPPTLLDGQTSSEISLRPEPTTNHL
jgi:hypothetical protein